MTGPSAVAAAGDAAVKAVLGEVPSVPVVGGFPPGRAG